MDLAGVGRALTKMGLAVFLIGIALQGIGKVPGLGRLPGDIVIKREGFVFYFPVVTSLLISAILSLLFFLFRR